MKKALASIIIVIFSAVAVVTTITFLSIRSSQQAVRFKRRFINTNLQVIRHVKLDNPLRTICTMSDSILYFDTDVPGVIYQSNYYLTQLSRVPLNFKTIDSIASLFDSHVSLPAVYLAAGNVPAVIKTSPWEKKVSVYRIPGATFTHSVMVTGSTFVFRAYKQKGGKWDQIFVKANLETGEIQEESDISDNNGDAGFSTDGLLHFDKLTNTLVYIFHYKSQFICMDTNLTLRYKGTTVDNSAPENVSTTSINTKSNIIITTNGPLKDVNLESCVNNGMLYNVSTEKAANESKSDFMNHSIVDIYNLINGAYKGSFYLPNFQHENLVAFYVRPPFVIGLYKSYLVSYKMTPS